MSKKSQLERATFEKIGKRSGVLSEKTGKKSESLFEKTGAETEVLFKKTGKVRKGSSLIEKTGKVSEGPNREGTRGGGGGRIRQGIFARKDLAFEKKG